MCQDPGKIIILAVEERFRVVVCNNKRAADDRDTSSLKRDMRGIAAVSLPPVPAPLFYQLIHVIRVTY